MDEPRQTLLLRACASAQRSRSPFTRNDARSALRQLGRAEGRPDSSLVSVDELAAQLRELEEVGLLHAVDPGRWRLSETGERQVQELGDEHADDLTSLLDYLDTGA